MRKRTFIALAAVTAVAAVAAVGAVLWRDAALDSVPAREAIYPGLAERLNDVDRVTIRSASDGTVTLERRDGGWVMVERHGYPASFEKIRAALLALSGIEAVEPRTTRPEHFGRLEVGDVEAEGSKSVRVTAQAGDTTVADLLIGRMLPPTEGGGMFARRAGENQAWLVKGGEQRPDRSFVNWLQRDIVNIDQRRVQAVAITHADGDQVILAKSEPGATDYQLESKVPEGREPKPPHELSALAGLVDFLVLEDVRPVGELDFAGPATTAEFQTYDGLKLRLDAVEADGRTWVKLAADTTNRHPELDAFVEQHKGQDSPEGRTAALFKTAEEVAEEAAAINARVGDWAYRLTDYKTDKLRTGTGEITQPVAQAEAAGDKAPAQRTN